MGYRAEQSEAVVDMAMGDLLQSRDGRGLLGYKEVVATAVLRLSGVALKLYVGPVVEVAFPDLALLYAVVVEANLSGWEEQHSRRLVARCHTGRREVVEERVRRLEPWVVPSMMRHTSAECGCRKSPCELVLDDSVEETSGRP